MCSLIEIYAHDHKAVPSSSVIIALKYRHVQNDITYSLFVFAKASITIAAAYIISLSFCSSLVPSSDEAVPAPHSASVSD